MGIGSKLNTEIMAWVSLCIVVVIGSVILLKFKDVSGVTSGLNTTIDAFVSAIAEPKNWVAIVVIALIGFGVLKLVKRGK